MILSFNAIAGEFQPLPRIKTAPGEPFAKLYNTKLQQDFIAIGNSYVDLLWIDGAPHHCNFTPGLYDKLKIESAFSIMRKSGYNMVRTFIDKGHPHRNKLAIYGVEGPYDSDTPVLYQPYMDNLIDFLERATKYKIYVVIAFEGLPYNRYYSSLASSEDTAIEGRNRTILAKNAIKAKEIYLEEFVKNIYTRNPNLLTTILAYDVQNELYCRSDEKPFSETHGIVKTANGKKYDMSDPVSRQACQDDNTVNWAQHCIKAIKKYDPDALVCTSVFPFWPVKKVAGNGLLPLDTQDKRWPARVSVLINRTDFDLIDIHPYLGWQGSMEQILQSSEWNSLNKTIKPFVAFEYGVHRYEKKVPVGNAQKAGQVLYEWRQQMLDFGFVGASLFTWHTTTHTRWTATEDGQVINEYLRPCPQWFFDNYHSLENWTFNNKGWEFKQYSFSIPVLHNYSRSPKNEPEEKINTAIAFDFNKAGKAGAPFLESPWIQMNAFSSLALKIKLKNNSTLKNLRLFWISDVDSLWQQTNSHDFILEARSNEEREYLIRLGDNPNWRGQIRRIKLIGETNEEIRSGSLEIKEVGFVNCIDK
jgi:hypothetical protein